MYHITVETATFIQGDFVHTLRAVQAGINFYFKIYPDATITLSYKK